jgi:hypothetical protein
MDGRLSFPEHGTGTSHRFEGRTTRIGNRCCRRLFFSHNDVRRKSTMTKSKLLGAAAMLAAAIATPAMAQEAIQEPGAYAQAHPWASDYHYRHGRSGFWPGDVAAGVVGGAIGVAGAIASAPFRGGDPYAYDSYAYYGGSAPYDDPYAYYDRPRYRRTTCGLQPGATYLGPDGRWYPC